MFDGVIPFTRTRFRMRSDDPSFHVAWRGGGRFLFSGEVEEDPTTELEVETPSGDLEVPLAVHSTPADAVQRLERVLPRDVVLTSKQQLDGVEVQLTEAVIPAAKLPRVRVFSTDLVQRIAQLDENKVELRGAVGADCHVTMLVDSKRITLAVPGGCSAATTATRLGASMPKGYRALVDGSTVTVWKDADFYEMVA